MDDVRIAELCEALSIPRYLAEAWSTKARNFITPEHTPETGKARLWSFKDAVKLALLSDLAEADISLVSYSPYLIDLRPYENETTYLIICKGAAQVIHPTRRGQNGVPAFHWVKKVRGSKLAEFLADKRRHPAVVLNLTAVYGRTEAAFRQINGGSR